MGVVTCSERTASRPPAKRSYGVLSAILRPEGLALRRCMGCIAPTLAGLTRDSSGTTRDVVKKGSSGSSDQGGSPPQWAVLVCHALLDKFIGNEYP
jgi:hypothetical protein